MKKFDDLPSGCRAFCLTPSAKFTYLKITFFVVSVLFIGSVKTTG